MAQYPFGEHGSELRRVDGGAVGSGNVEVETTLGVLASLHGGRHVARWLIRLALFQFHRHLCHDDHLQRRVSRMIVASPKPTTHL